VLAVLAVLPNMATLREVVIQLAEAGQLYVTNQVSAAQLLPEAHWLTRWAVEGQRTGQEWCSCDVCGEIQLIKPAPKRVCHMSYRCRGHMVRIAPRPRLTKAVIEALRYDAAP
jgi:hypothetical protein